MLENRLSHWPIFYAFGQTKYLPESMGKEYRINYQYTMDEDLLCKRDGGD